MSKPTAIAFVGMPGSGKGTCTDYLAEQGFPVFHFGNMLVDEVKRRYGETSPEKESIVRVALREEQGAGVLAKLAAQAADLALAANPDTTVVFDGLYSWTEFKELREKYGKDLVLILTFTPKTVRYERLSKRPVRPFTPQEAEARDIHEIESIEKGGPIAFADHLLHNTQTPEALIEELNLLLKQLSITT